MSGTLSESELIKLAKNFDLSKLMAEIRQLLAENKRLTADLSTMSDAREHAYVNWEAAEADLIAEREEVARLRAENERLEKIALPVKEAYPYLIAVANEKALIFLSGCTHAFSEDGEFWTASCGSTYRVTKETPPMTFCHHCGRRLVVDEPAAEDADAE